MQFTFIKCECAISDYLRIFLKKANKCKQVFTKLGVLGILSAVMSVGAALFDKLNKCRLVLTECDGYGIKPAIRRKLP